MDEIYQEMLRCFEEEAGITLQGSSEMAVRLYALAAQVYGLYVQNQWTLTQCFPQTAQGEYLDYHATLRGLSRSPARRAEGNLRFFVTEIQEDDLQIAKGNVCLTAGLLRFETKEDAVLPAGALSVDVAAQAAETGPGGNVPQGMVRVMSVAPLGIDGCTNPEPFTGGAGEEEDERFRERILDTFRRMPNGANIAYYEREALAFNGVAAVNVLARKRGIGTVDVVISAPGGQPEEEDIQEVKEHLERQREIAVDVEVLPPVEQGVEVQVQIKAREGSTFAKIKDQVEQSLSAYFNGSLLGKAVLRAQLGKLVYEIPGVENYRITQPAQDVEGSAGRRPRLSCLLVEEMA